MLLIPPPHHQPSIPPHPTSLPRHVVTTVRPSSSAATSFQQSFFFCFVLRPRTIYSPTDKIYHAKLSLGRFFNKNLKRGRSVEGEKKAKKQKNNKTARRPLTSWHGSPMYLSSLFTPGPSRKDCGRLRAMKQAKNCPGPNEGSSFVPFPKKQAPIRSSPPPPPPCPPSPFGSQPR